MAIEIKLQALKEGVETVEVNAVKVSPGDVVAKDQTLLEVQADKAALDVASPLAGKVSKVLVKPGDQIKIGQPYCLLEASNGAATAPAATVGPSKTAGTAPPPKSATPAAPQTEPIRRAPEPPPEPKAPPPRPAPAPASRPATAVADKLTPAGPATRRLARELGINLREVHGSGRHGRVIEDDIKAYVRQLASGGSLAVSDGQPSTAPPLPSFEAFGPVERTDLSRVRKLTARQMSLAWSQIPHVTQHDLADITELEAFRKQQQGKGPKLTVTAFVIKAVAIALKQFPTFNASLDTARSQLVVKKYFHIGVAVDTDAGLLVPVIRDVDKKSVEELAAEVAEVAQKARQGKADMSGGTFTVTNLGGIGGTGFTPIVNWPEVAILGLSRSRLEPVIRDGQVVPRLMLPLSLSYDHRVIDGASAARFTRHLAEMLENPFVMLLHA